jgi:hypothetical protein
VNLQLQKFRDEAPVTRANVEDVQLQKRGGGAQTSQPAVFHETEASKLQMLFASAARPMGK